MSTPDLPSSPRLSRRLRWLLIGSLALNVLVLGSLAGMGLRHMGGEGPPHAAERGGVSFGPWSGGLRREDHKAIRRAIDAQGHDFRADFRADRADREKVLAALKADSFDRAAVEAALVAIEGRAAERMRLGNRMILDHVAGLDAEARRAMAERIEAAEAARRQARHGSGRENRAGEERN